jgi:hypothetical protein
MRTRHGLRSRLGTRLRLGSEESCDVRRLETRLFIVELLASKKVGFQ